MYFLQDLINKLYNLWGGGCRKHTPPTYHTANSIPQHAKRENRKILNGGQHKMLKISHLPRIMIRMKRKGKAAVGGRVYQRSVCRYPESKISGKARHPGRCKHRPLQITFMAIPHNSKCRYGERGTADAKPKAQIILDAAKVSAASGGNSEPKQGQRSQSARGFCSRSTMRVPQPDIIEHFGNADAVPQPPERCLSR